MVFLKRRKHKLPKFPGTLIPAFRALCEVLPVEEVAKFPEYIDQRIEQLTEESRENLRINVPLAEKVAVACKLLVTLYEQQSPDHRALIVGAVRYFAIADDAVSEEAFASGMDDDAKVVNHVLEELGIVDQYVELY